MSLLYENAEEQAESSTEANTFDMIPLRGTVPFPGYMIHAELGKEMDPSHLQTAMQSKSPVFLAVQMQPELQTGGEPKLYEIGVVARVFHILQTAGGSHQVLFECLYRAKRLSEQYADGKLLCKAVKCEEEPEDTVKGKKLLAKLVRLLTDYVRYLPQESNHLPERLRSLQDAGSVADFIARNYLESYSNACLLLQELDPIRRAEDCCTVLEKAIASYELESSIQAKVKYRLQRRQRDAYLREELNVIREELGMDDRAQADEYEDIDSYEKKIAEAKLPAEVEEKLKSEAAKLAKMPFGSAESTVIQNYLDTCLELPWLKYSRDRLDLTLAQKILDEDHEGIEKVKERILEFLAVKQLNPNAKGQLLCLVGPPGVGKTSVARSVARATNRKFVRISLGGVRDEAEIRGHRKTYIGAMPGRIINAVKQAQTANPVILLDELDKLTTDAHGDPASALLEVLDSEQNSTFRDHFLELPFDLSSVLFIATANTLNTVPQALLDRLEVIEMNSYTDREKLQIAKNHLIPKQLKNHGLKKTQCRFTDEALMLLITGYTHENGVRNLERAIACVCRKTARRIVAGEIRGAKITEEAVQKALGPVKYLSEKMGDRDEVGIVNGLAWTSLGGELLRVEVSSVQGDGKLELTGSLGDVMKESAKAAVSYIRKHSSELGVDPEFYTKRDVHIHVPEGAVPKDGPSAGVTLCTALVSELTGKTVRRNIAMTGEITLTGRVLPIGGLREKTMAAYKYGCDTVIIPYDNRGDVEEMDGEVREHLKMVPVKTVSEVLRLAVNP